MKFFLYVPYFIAVVWITIPLPSCCKESTAATGTQVTEIFTETDKAETITTANTTTWLGESSTAGTTLRYSTSAEGTSPGTTVKDVTSSTVTDGSSYNVTDSTFTTVTDDTSSTMSGVTSTTATDGTSTTVTDGTSTTVTDGTSTTVTDGTSATVTDGISATVTDGTSSNVTDGTSSTVTDGTSTTVRDGTSTTMTDGTSTNVTDDTSSTVTDDTSSTMTEGTATTVRDGTSTNATDGTSSTVKDGTSTTVTVGTSIPGSSPDGTDVSTTRVDDKTNTPNTQSTETMSTVTKATEQRTTQPPSRSTEAISSPRVTTTLPEPQSPSANYPKATYPEIDGSESTLILKKIHLEVAANNVGCEESDNLEGDECKKLITDFGTFGDQKYNGVSGYNSVENIKLRKGSVIIGHEVWYIYNQMTPEDRQLSAEEIYDRTLAPSIANNEPFGDSTFIECDNCTDPEAANDLCEGHSVSCEGMLVAQCSDSVWRCESPCANTENFYCAEKSAFCTQEASDKTPKCRCLQSEDGWYIGAQCQFYVDRIWLIVGFSVGGGVVLIIIIILIICLCQTRKELKETRRMPYEKTNEAFLLGNDHLHMDGATDSHEMDQFVNGTYITDEDEAMPKPYSYVYADNVDANYGKRGSKEVKAHGNNPELERALQGRGYADNKQPNQSFWGNLEHEVPHTTEQNQYDSNFVNIPKAKSGKQQANGYSPQKRPKSADLPPADYDAPSSDPFSKRYTQIVSDDYGKPKKKY